MSIDEAYDTIIDITMQDNDILNELKRASYGNSTSIETFASIRSEAALEATAVFRRIVEKLIAFDTILMHGAVVAKGNDSYMFAAPSGTGKSTRVQLWIQEYPDSIVVNGDKPFIRMTDSEVIAYGSPWCGKEGWHTNTQVPLRAVFLLERAGKEEKDSIEEISLTNAFPELIRQTYCPADATLMCKTIQLLKEFEGRVKIYRFRSNPTPEAVRLAYNTASRR